MNLNTKQGMAEAKAWTQRLIDSLNDGGSWLVPRSGTIIVFDKVLQIAHIKHEMMPDESIKKVLKEMGWTVANKE